MCLASKVLKLFDRYKLVILLNICTLNTRYLYFITMFPFEANPYYNGTRPCFFKKSYCIREIGTMWQITLFLLCDDDKDDDDVEEEEEDYINISEGSLA